MDRDSARAGCHLVLIAAIAARVADKRMLKVIRAFLKAGVVEDGLASPLDEGPRWGGPLSPILSNLVLPDELETEQNRRVKFDGPDCTPLTCTPEVIAKDRPVCYFPLRQQRPA